MFDRPPPPLLTVTRRLLPGECFALGDWLDVRYAVGRYDVPICLLRIGNATLRMCVAGGIVDVLDVTVQRDATTVTAWPADLEATLASGRRRRGGARPKKKGPKRRLPRRSK